MNPHVVWVTRIAVGAALGGTIGYERDRHGKHVGLRTHLIVAMAAATFMVVSAQFVHFQNYSEGQFVEVDGSRIAASVVSGIGFLAGGAILRTGLTIQGLTTAAGLWLVTAIGLASGGGMYVEAVAATVLGMLALTVLRRFEDKNDQVVQRRISLVLPEGPNPIEAIDTILSELGGTVSNVAYEKRLDDKPRVMVTVDVRLPVAVTLGRLTERLESLKDVRRIHVEQPH